MKFKVGFLLGAAAGVWAANKASELQHGPGSARPATAPPPATADEAAEKLKALSGLARERITTIAGGPLGNLARERLTEAISSSLSGARSNGGSRRRNGSDPIDTRGGWRN
jgi:hypothetical protein